MGKARSNKAPFVNMKKMENHERYKKEKKKDASTTTHRYHKQLRVLPAGAWRSWLFPSMIRFKRMVASLFVIWEENVFFFFLSFAKVPLRADNEGSMPEQPHFTTLLSPFAKLGHQSLVLKRRPFQIHGYFIKHSHADRDTPCSNSSTLSEQSHCNIRAHHTVITRYRRLHITTLSSAFRASIIQYPTW